MQNLLVVGERRNEKVCVLWRVRAELVLMMTVWLFYCEITSKRLCLSEPQFSCPQNEDEPHPPCRAARWLKCENLHECAFKSHEGLGSMGFVITVGVNSKSEWDACQWNIRNGVPKKMWWSRAERQEVGFQFITVSYTNCPPLCSLGSSSVKWRSKYLPFGAILRS